MKSSKKANKQAENYLNRILTKGGEVYHLHNGFGIEFKNGSFLNAYKYEPLKRTEIGCVIDKKRKHDDYTVEFWSGKKLGNGKYINCTNLRAKKIYDSLKHFPK